MYIDRIKHLSPTKFSLVEFTLPLWQVLTTSCEFIALMWLPWLEIEIHNCDQFVWLAETDRIILNLHLHNTL